MFRVSRGTPLNWSGRRHRVYGMPFNQPECRRGGLEEAAFRLGSGARWLRDVVFLRNGNGNGTCVKGSESIGTKTARVFLDWERDLARRKVELENWAQRLEMDLTKRKAKLGIREGELTKFEIELERRLKKFEREKTKLGGREAALAEETGLLDCHIEELAEWQDRLVRKEELLTKLSGILDVEQEELTGRETKLKQKEGEIKSAAEKVLERKKKKVDRLVAEFDRRKKEEERSVRSGSKPIDAFNQPLLLFKEMARRGNGGNGGGSSVKFTFSRSTDDVGVEFRGF